MSLLLDTQYLEGFVTEEELARCAGPLAAAGEALAAGDGAPKGWRTLPEGFPEPLLRQLADTGRRIRESAEVLLVIGHRRLLPRGQGSAGLSAKSARGARCSSSGTA